MKILITGAAGFIGFHTVQRFINEGYEILGADNINDYYDTNLKYDRLKASGIDKLKIKHNAIIKSERWSNYSFIKIDIEEKENVFKIFKEEAFDMIIHLAAQAGVRYSIQHPDSYIKSNIVGFFNILEACRHFSVNNLLYASSSSVYGLSNQKLGIDDKVDSPISLYAATKKSNELMAHVYSHLYGITTTGLRFFTVYGPWGRPDMAPFIFADAIFNNKTIKVFNHGKMKRDFTFIDDIVEGIFAISKTKLKKQYNIFNIGNNSPVNLLDFISCLEKEIGKKANTEMRDIQPGDVVSTWADTKELVACTGYQPKTSIDEGVKQLLIWYKNYYKL